MIIELTPRLEAVIREKVSSGRYANAREVIEDALLLMENRDKVERLRAAIAVGLEQVERGEVIPWTADSMERLIQEAEEEDRQGLPLSADVLP
jgi:antitoxin ParD1/3/4